MNFMIQTSDPRINLIDVIKLILDFNEEPNQIWFKNIKTKNESVKLISKKHSNVINHFM